MPADDTRERSSRASPALAQPHQPVLTTQDGRQRLEGAPPCDVTSRARPRNRNRTSGSSGLTCRVSGYGTGGLILNDRE